MALSDLLELSVNTAYESSGANPVPKAVFNFSPTGLSEFINLGALKVRLERLRSQANLTEKQQFAINEILKIYRSGV